MDPLSLVAIGGKLLDLVGSYFPSAEAKAKAQMALLELAQKGELAHLSAEFELAKGQIDVNKTEAANEHLFVSGWRPAFGWIGALGFTVQFLIGPLSTFFAQILGHPDIVFPKLDFSEMLPIIFGMLGLGAYRTVEKVTQMKNGK